MYPITFREHEFRMLSGLGKYNLLNSVEYFNFIAFESIDFNERSESTFYKNRHSKSIKGINQKYSKSRTFASLRRRALPRLSFFNNFECCDRNSFLFS